MRTRRLTPLRGALVMVVALVAQIAIVADLRVAGAVGYGIGLACAGLFRPTGWPPLAVAALAALGATAFYTGVGHLVGTPYPWGDVPGITLAVGLWNAALVLPAVAVTRWVHGPTEPDR